jgi:hypothetical protein
MTAYRHIKWGVFMFVGCFACYHNASFAAAAAFVMAGLQPVLSQMEDYHVRF